MAILIFREYLEYIRTRTYTDPSAREKDEKLVSEALTLAEAEGKTALAQLLREHIAEREQAGD